MRRFEEWTVAYRKKKDNQVLIDNKKSMFRTIKNTWRYWCADPHIIEVDRETYVFAEMYDRVFRRGVIGYCKLSDKGYTPWSVVLRRPYHLSYPHLFAIDNDVYMIPESYAGNEIAVYKAVAFPEKWERIHVLKSNCVAVDSTVYFDGSKRWMLTLEFEKGQQFFNIYTMENGALTIAQTMQDANDDQIRPAGKLFVHNGKLYRPAQDCSKSYGGALNIFQVTSISEDAYSEVLVDKIAPSSICTDLGTVPQGVHTYNVSDQYEVIDLKEYKIDLWFMLCVRYGLFGDG